MEQEIITALEMVQDELRFLKESQERDMDRVEVKVSNLKQFYQKMIDERLAESHKQSIEVK